MSHPAYHAVCPLRPPGDRQLDLILPKQYGPMWRELGEARRAREEAAAARRARDEERKKAEEARRRRQNMRTPQARTVWGGVG